MTQLFWKSDKETIERLLKELPSKYILGRYRSSKMKSIDGYSINHTVSITWKGYVFSISQKALKNELFERKDIALFSNKQHRWDLKYFVIPKPKKVKKEKNIKKNNIFS